MNRNTRPDLRSRAGSSIVEGMIAAVLVGVAAVGTASLIDYIQKQSRRAQILNRAMTIQSALVRAVMSKDQYVPPAGVQISPQRQALLAQMVAGGTATGLEILADPTNPASLPLARVGQRVGYDLDGAAATCTSDCAVWVDTDVSCVNAGTRGCRAAYRVTIQKQAAGDVPPAPLGALPPTTVNSSSDPRQYVGFPNINDYTVPVSYDIFQQSPGLDCGSQTDGLAITGMNRTTGALTCVSRQVVACPAPQIGHGVQAVSDGTNMRMALQCHSLANVQCPPEYVLQEMDFGQLDPGGISPQAVALNSTGTMGGLKGICVYRWLNNIPWQGPAFVTPSTADTASHSAKVCNTDVYYANTGNGCQWQWDSQPPLYCPATCYTYDSRGRVTGSYECGHYAGASASVSPQPPSPPTPDSDNFARCTINVQQSSCSGGTTNWTAHAFWNGTCIVKESWPGRNPSLKHPPVGGVMGP